jgi:predicted small secreted protein
MDNIKIMDAKRVFSLLIIAGTLTVLSSAACNTARGVGQDIERGGEKTQDAAETVRRRL